MPLLLETVTKTQNQGMRYGTSKRNFLCLYQNSLKGDHDREEFVCVDRFQRLSRLQVDTEYPIDWIVKFLAKNVISNLTSVCWS